MVNVDYITLKNNFSEKEMTIITAYIKARFDGARDLFKKG